MTHRPSTARPRPSGLSPAARNLAEWFRRLGDLVHSARVLGVEHEQVTRGRELLVDAMATHVEYHAPLVFRCSPLEIWLRDEMLVEPPAAGDDDPAERRVPFLLYRDGVRGFTLDARTSAGDVRALVQALVLAAGAPSDDDDIVTRLWECDLTGLNVELATLDQALPRALPASDTAKPLPAPPAPEWAAVTGPADPLALWRAGDPALEDAMRSWKDLWRFEHESCRSERAGELVDAVLDAGTQPAARAALAAGLAHWLAGAAQRSDWTEVAQALDVLHRTDPDRTRTDGQIRRALADVDAAALADRLDEADRETLARFLALVVRIGAGAVELVVGVLARSGRARVRAVATTALGYAAGSAPATLTPHLRHPRWFVVRNVVTALGQIGGEEIAPPLGVALRHADPRVRRAAVTALGQVPAHRRTPLLVSQLDLGDPDTQDAVLALLAREPDARAVDEILRRIAAPGFGDRAVGLRVAMIEALGQVGDDAVIPTLESLLHQGGWLAKKGPERSAAARALASLRTPAALEVLHAGAGARADAVREACLAALETLREAA